MTKKTKKKKQQINKWFSMIGMIGWGKIDFVIREALKGKNSKEILYDLAQKKGKKK